MAMVNKELKAHVATLQTIANKPEAVDQVIAVLKALNQGAAPSENDLRATKAGAFVGKLRAHNNSEVKKLAAEIVHKWKSAVELAKKKGAASPTTKNATPPPKSPAPAPSAKFTGDPEKRSYKTDGVNHKRTGDDTRDDCVGILYNGIAYKSREPAETVMIKAVEVERAVFTEYSGDGTSVTDAYKKQIRMLFANLKNKQQAGMLGKKVLMGAISADDFAKADAESLKSEALKKLEVKLKEENMKNAQVPMAEKSISTALECGKCKKKLVSYTQAQTRSADEPMTTFCECTNCGNRWKFS